MKMLQRRIVAGISLRKNIAYLQEALEARTREAEHLSALVQNMEASATNDEVIKTQIADLKNELANAEGKNFKRLIFTPMQHSMLQNVSEVIKRKNEEVLLMKRDLKEREELIQQREIDISCLRGQVKEALLDLDVADDDEDSDTLTCDCSSEDEQILIDDLGGDDSSSNK